MTLPPIFPEAEDDGCAPHRAIAQRLGCSEDQVHDAFRGLNVPEWSTPEHFDAVKTRILALNEAARLAENLVLAMGRLPPDAVNLIVQAGGSTTAQIEYLSSLLAGDAASLEEWRKNRFRGGRSDPSAEIVAEGMRRLFRRLRKPITYGQGDSGGAPSTDFGRAVDFALAAFGLRAHWRRAAEKAHKKQTRIEGRRLRRALAQHERLRAGANRTEKES